MYAPGNFVVQVNGTIIGLTRFPTRFVHNFRRLRRAGRVSEFVSIYINHHHRTVIIASDGGRICRPMIIVDGGKPSVTEHHTEVRLNPQRNSCTLIRFHSSSNKVRWSSMTSYEKA
jgi:DNA-directed RNA polymerase III subunit RPC2